MDFIAIPKVELHVHLEGTMQPTLLAELATRNHLPLPERVNLKTNTITWKNLFDFFDAYDVCANLICTPADLTQVTYEYLKQAALVGTIYVELTVSPQHTKKLGMDYPTTCAAVAQGIEKAASEYDIHARMIMVLVRHYDHADCLEVVQNVIRYPHPYVVGIGLAGDEKNHGPEFFIEAFDLARLHGLHTTAHAGEWYGPRSIKDTIELLKVERIGHGLQAIYDFNLLELIKNKAIHLELCLSSNLLTHAMASGIPDGQIQLPHPAKKFKKFGLSLSLNTDDPPYFNSNMAKEFQIAHEQFGYTEEDLYQVSYDSIMASFAEQELKETLLKKF